MPETIRSIDFVDEMSTSYVDYAMSVITARAIPDVRDGLKPVQRRILYSMKELGLRNDGPFKKSARIVGDTMGKYHPHGDSSIYEAMVNLAKPWQHPIPFVAGHGNFGSIEGDGAAAMRYTEAKLSKFSEELYLKDLEKGVVDFMPNFDESEKEPKVLPVQVPNLLVMGTEGIAVGMASNIPSHNLFEVMDGLVAYIDNPEIDNEGLMEYVKGPDFATGGIIANKDELLSIYETGRGKVKIRGKVEVVPGKNGRSSIMITEIPFTMVGRIDKFMTSIADLVRDKKLPDVVDIRNLSAKGDTRICIDVKRGADVENIINILYKKCRLEDTYGVQLLAIVDNKPKYLSLKEVFYHFHNFQKEVYEKKYSYLLNREEEKLEVKQGLKEAVDCIDLIIEILRGSKSSKDAKECLMYGKTENIKFRYKGSEADAQELHFTERQTNAILEMRLQKLIGLEILALEKEISECQKNIALWSGYLKSAAKMTKLIKSDMMAIRDHYAVERRTVITNAEAAVIKKEEIKEQQLYALLDRFYYIKVIDQATYDRNRESAERDFRAVVPIMNTDKLCIFTKDGKMHQVKVFDIPLGKYKDKGVPIDNISNYTNDVDIVGLIPLQKLIVSTIFFCSESGQVKQVAGTEFNTTRKTIDAIKAGEGIAYAHEIDRHTDQVVMKSKNGYFLRFPMGEVSEQKKNAAGVKGMKFDAGDGLDAVWIGNAQTEIFLEETKIAFTRIKLGSRGGKGTKLRL